LNNAKKGSKLFGMELLPQITQKSTDKTRQKFNIQAALVRC